MRKKNLQTDKYTVTKYHKLTKTSKGRKSLEVRVLKVLTPDTCIIVSVRRS